MNTAPLTERVSRSELRSFISSTDIPGSAKTGLRASFWAFAVMVLLIEVITALIFLTSDGSVPVLLLVIGPIAIAGYGLIQVFRWLPRRIDWRALLRISRFAAANGLTPLPLVPDPPQYGMIFGLGSHRLATGVVRMHTAYSVEFGNHRYLLEPDDENSHSIRSRMHRWGYIAISLDVPLPHIVLDARRNDKPFRSNLPFDPAKDQRLSLEGDVDRHFTLYCPSGYEADALYLFSPDVLAHLIDAAEDFDVEIIEDRLYLYSGRDVSTTDPGRWERVIGIAQVVQTKLDQWARWRDDRLVDEDAGGHRIPQAAQPPVLPDRPVGVAKPGRRLRRAVPWIAVILGVLYLVFGIASKFF